MDLKITFTVPNGNVNIYSDKNGKRTFSAGIENGNLNIEVYYDFCEKPLCLHGITEESDNVEINLISHKLELVINGKITDEEWCAGKCMFEYGDKINSSVKTEVSEFLYKEAILPAVIGHFENAEGWKPEKNVFVGDCMPYVNNGRYHVLYLKDRHHHQSKWGLGAHQWNHISTADFKHWDIHPTAVKITEPYEGSICTGSWIKKDVSEYLFYSIRMSDRSAAPLCRSISADGFHFEKDRDFSVKLSEKYHTPSVKDPKIFSDENGLYHMMVTTSLVKERKGCLAHLVSADLNSWKEEKPFFVNDTDDQPECPDLIKYNGFYYMVYSLGGKAHYMYAENLSGNWHLPKNPVIPCHAVPKGAVWNNKIIFTGFKYDTAEYTYAGTMTLKTAVSAENGELIFL